MTDEQIQIEVAKIDGWKQASDGWWDRNKDLISETGLPFEKLPDYLHSRDAIVPVIERVCVSYELKPKFIRQLELVRYDNEPPVRQEDSIWEFGYGEAFEIILEATPRQLCIALLKAKGLWKD